MRIRTVPSSPPPEVYDAMGVAAQAYDNLQASGAELRFKVDDATGNLTVEVHDVRANLRFTVPAGAVLDIASGRPLGPGSLLAI